MAGVLVGTVLLIIARSRVQAPDPPRSPQVVRPEPPNELPVSNPREQDPPKAAKLPIRKKSPATVSRGSPELFAGIRLILNRNFETALKSGGARAAFQYLKGLLETHPDDLKARLERAYAIRYFPYLYETDTSLRPEIRDLLESRLSRDRDSYARLVALTALTDHAVAYSQLSDTDGLWMTHLNTPLTPGSLGYDSGCLGLSPVTDVRLRSAIWGQALQDDQWENRKAAMRVLRAQVQPGDASNLEKAATTDPDESVRHYAIQAIGDLPRDSAIAIPALRKVLDTDAEEQNPEAASANLVSRGMVDDTIVSTLLGIAEKDGSTYETVGKAYAISKSARLMAVINDCLVSGKQELRTAGVQAVAASASADLLPLLSTSIETERDPRLKQQMIKVRTSLQ